MNCYVKITWGAILCMIIIELMVDCQNTQYQFKRYTYKKKRDDKKFRNAKTPCEGRPDCLAHQGVDQLMCVRECMSKFCYEELYKNDLLEEGEIDVRLNSFKGCLSQQSNNIYSQTNNNVDLDGNYVLNWNKMLHVLMMDGHQVTQMIFKDFNGITTIYHVNLTWRNMIIGIVYT